MAKAYQYTADGYYAGEVDDYGILPNNATRTAPTLKKGFVPCWDGIKWRQVEDHKGESGYVNGQPHEIKEYGPLPEGWSDTPTPPTIEELFDRLRSFRNARIADALWMRERHADELEIGKETSLTPDQYITLLTYIQALRDIPAQPGAPWPGGDIPWPIKPNV